MIPAKIWLMDKIATIGTITTKLVKVINIKWKLLARKPADWMFCLVCELLCSAVSNYRLG